jgi:hypothetical protein
MTPSKSIISQAAPAVVFVAVFLIGALAGFYWGRWGILYLTDALSPIIPDARTASFAQRAAFLMVLWTYHAVTILVLPCWAAWRCSLQVRRLLIPRQFGNFPIERN